MNPGGYLAEFERRGVRFSAQGARLVVDAPKGLLTAQVRALLAQHKVEILREMSRRGCGSRNEPLLARASRESLVDRAANVATVVRFTVRETEDVAGDVDLLRTIRRVIEEHQPGGNRILMRIVTLGGRSVTVEWRALAQKSLRLGIARILAIKAARSD